MDKYEVIECTSAAEFLDTLRRSNRRWCHDLDVPWVFRGQENADWPLLPVLHRPEESRGDLLAHLYRGAEDELATFCAPDLLRRRAEVIFPKVETNEQLERVRQALCLNAAEHLGVVNFLQMVNQLGFEVPGDTMPAGHHFEFSWAANYDMTGPPFGYALAQHHGVPTRLLDWTHSPMFAAFFAAEKAEPEKHGHFAVIALRTDENWNPWVSIRATGSRVPYLRAQHGMFTYRRGADAYFIYHGRWPSLDEEMPKALKKVTLHNSHATEVLRMLWAEGISLAHLMPTHDNITKTITLHWKRLLTGFFEAPRQAAIGDTQ